MLVNYSKILYNSLYTKYVDNSILNSDFYKAYGFIFYRRR